jgi:hypothetical protein
MQPNQLQSQGPVRVKAHKGFFAVVDGKLGQVNPGDVVDLDRAIARDVVSKIELVAPTTALVRQTNYLPERKRNPKPTDTGSELAALRASVDALTKTVTLLLERETAPAGKGKG